MNVERFEELERLADKVAQNFCEILGDRNNLRNELAIKNEEIEKIRREMTEEIEELKLQCQLYEEERSQFDSKIESLHNRLDSILESKSSEIFTGA
jgi:predicted  nucleic acid-binding Zn-ribbon protein